MVFYLESKYGKDWADPVTSTLNYTEDEIAEGLELHQEPGRRPRYMMNLKDYYSANSDTATHQSNEWITGKIAGIFEWDSAASKYSSALDDDNKGRLHRRRGDQVRRITTAASPRSPWAGHHQDLRACVAEAATLINFLLNEEKGASIMGFRVRHPRFQGWSGCCSGCRRCQGSGC